MKNGKSPSLLRGVLFLIGVFVLFRLPFWFACWQMTQAIRSFDAYSTDFSIECIFRNPRATTSFVKASREDLTEQQLAILQEYVDSFRLKRPVFLAEFKEAGGPDLVLTFESTYGFMVLRGGRVAITNRFQSGYGAIFENDQGAYQAVKSMLQQIA